MSDANRLTFAEAMAMNPSEVEVREQGCEWRPFADCVHTATIAVLRTCTFRRARPRRSRVQEMAEAWRCNVAPIHGEAMAAEAIRAVCEYLRTERIGAWAVVGPAEHAWSAVEREFLGPR